MGRYIETLGSNAPATFGKFQALKYGDEWEAFNAYARAVKSGELTALADFNLYQSKITEIDRVLVGIVTQNGLTVTGKPKRYIARTIGSISQHRNGVDVPEALDTLLHPVRSDPIKKDENGRSQRFVGQGAAVTINPDTGKLIQVNPLQTQKAKENVK